MKIYVETEIRGIRTEASFKETETYAGSYERTSRAGARVIDIDLFAEDMPRDEEEAVAYLHANY
jgi:hypothetical protein